MKTDDNPVRVYIRYIASHWYSYGCVRQGELIAVTKQSRCFGFLLKQEDRDRQLVLATRKRRPCRHIESCPTGALLPPWLRFSRAIFLSCKAKARVQHAKTGHGPHSSHVRRLNFTATWSKFWVRILESLTAKVIPSHKAYCLLSIGPQFAHVGVFNRDGKSA